MTTFTPAPVEASSGKTWPTLLARLRDGSDAVAWEDFFGRYWPLVHGFARRRGCSQHTAEEIVQDVMLKVFERKDLFQYDPARGRFRDWLRRLVENSVVDFRRRPGQRACGAGGDSNAPALEVEAPDASPEDAWETAFEQSLLLILLDVLRREMPPRAYLAFELSALHGLPGAQVAGHTGISRNGVYRARKRAIRRLRELGASYRDDGQLGEHLKHALRLRPQPAVERSLTDRIEKTMWSRQESCQE